MTILVNLSRYKYSPILAISPAEMAALQQLPSKERDLILPIFPLRGWMSATTLSKAISRIEQSIDNTRWWIADIDSSCLIGKKNENGEYKRQVFKEIEDLLDDSNDHYNWCQFISNQSKVIPTLQYNESIDESSLRRQADNLISFQRGLVVRIDVKNISATLFNKVINTLRGIESNQLFIVLDYGDIDRSTIVDVNQHIVFVSKIHKLFPDSYFSISSSSFPNSFSGSYRGEIPIYERQFYNKIRKQLSTMKMIYSDRGSARAERIKGGGGTPPPRIDYALKNDWRFVRKEFIGSLDKEELYKEAAIEVINSDYWMPSVAVWGVQMIELTAIGDPYGITNAGRATAARINMHIHMQLHYDELIESVDTDEDWVD